MTPQELRNALNCAVEAIETRDRLAYELNAIRATVTVNFGPEGRVYKLFTKEEIDRQTVHGLVYDAMLFLHKHAVLPQEPPQKIEQVLAAMEDASTVINNTKPLSRAGLTAKELSSLLSNNIQATGE